MKKLFSLLKRIIFSFVVLYGFNTIASNFSLVIPINIITVSLITVLGLPALFSLVLLLVIAFWGDEVCLKYIRTSSLYFMKKL